MQTTEPKLVVNFALENRTLCVRISYSLGFIVKKRGQGVFSSGVSSPWFSNGFAAGDAAPLRIPPSVAAVSPTVKPKKI
jgi:hypothetical protein